MKARLISYSQPVEQLKNEGITDANELIAYCARVSNPTNQLNSATAEKLIDYLIKHKHWSPLEMASACIELETTRDIARQLLRHRSFSFQEFSQRYSDPTEAFNFVTREARLQDSKNRQNSIQTTDVELQAQWEQIQNEVIDQTVSAYEWAISKGIAKEQARVVLPEGLTTSKLYVNGTIRSWVHYIEVRTDESTQLEHRELALAIAQAISQIYPQINKLRSN